MLKPILIMLPGLDGTGNLLQLPKENLKEYFDTRIISYPHNEELTYFELANHIEKLLPKEENFYLLAESFGGALALELAIRKPLQVKGLILSATFSKNPVLLPSLALHFSKVPYIKYLPLPLLDYIFSSYKSTSQVVKKLQSTLKGLNYDVINYRIKEVLNLKDNSRLSEIKVPILYLQGKYDNIILPLAYLHIKKVLPQTHKVEIDSGHMVLQCKPLECATLIKQFVGNIEMQKSILIY